MGKLGPRHARPPESGWDIAFTRMSQELAPHIGAWVSELTLRFKAFGLTTETQVRQTPRGLSTFLAVVGRQGLLLIVDITLIDGMTVGRQPGASLDVRLLDACGDIVALRAAPPFQTASEQVIAATGLEQSLTAVYVMAMGHFDLTLASASDSGM